MSKTDSIWNIGDFKLNINKIISQMWLSQIGKGVGLRAGSEVALCWKIGFI